MGFGSERLGSGDGVGLSCAGVELSPNSGGMDGTLRGSGFGSGVSESLKPCLFLSLSYIGLGCSCSTRRAGAAFAVVKGPFMDMTASAAAHAAVDVRITGYIKTNANAKRRNRKPSDLGLSVAFKVD